MEKFITKADLEEKQLFVTAIFDVIQDGFRRNGSILILEELRQSGCWQGTAYRRIKGTSESISGLAHQVQWDGTVPEIPRRKTDK